MKGETFAHYRILDKLGEGGMGAVYRAEDTKLGRQVALKVLPPELASDRERLVRFQREARTLATLDHPNIVHLYSVEEVGEAHFLTMQLVHGSCLTDVIPAGGMELGRLLEIAIPLADALRAAHESGVTHRDLKPDNVMVDREGRVKVLDFGLAKLRQPDGELDTSRLPTEPAMTRVGQVMGTAPYMSPEQVQGAALDHRTDLFSFGVMLYEMAVGKRPFRGDSSAAVVSSILRDTPAPVTEARPDLPNQLVRIVRRCLEKDVERRFQSAKEIRNELEDLRTELVTAPGVASERPVAGPAPRPWLGRLVGGAVVVAAILGATWWFASAPAPAPTPAPAAPRFASLAVLPLANHSGDPDQEYLAAGMTEALITDLSAIGDLRVISRTSAMRFVGSDLALPEIAQALGVEALIEGSVVREGDRVRITAKLIEAATDENLWAQSFERELTSVLRLQSEVASAIAESIEVTLTPDAESRLADRRTIDSEAYEAYLRGMHHLSKGTSEGFAKGIEFLNEAVDRDPADPLAYAGLALGYIRVGHDTGPSDLYFPRAVGAAERALELDPTSAMAHAALADALMYYEWDFPAAGDAFQKAVSLNRNLAETHAHYSWFHAIFGRWDEAIEHAREAKRLDPLSPVFTSWLAGIFWFAGDLDAALVEARNSLDLAPGFSYGLFQLGAVLSGMGRHDEAIAALEKASELQPASTWALAEAHGRAGHADKARGMLEDLERNGADAIGIARVYAALGDTDGAMRWLETAYERRHRWMPWIVTFPGLQAVHEHPRFRELVERMNIPFERPVSGEVVAAS